MYKFLIIIALFSFSLVASDKGNELLNSVREKYKSADDISADFQSVSKGQNDLTGKFFFKPENKIRIELKNLIIVSDGETSWNYNKKENKVIISEYNDADPSAFSLNKLLFDYPSQCNISVEGENVLVLTPKNNSELNFNKIKLWINKDNLVEKIQMQSSDKNVEVKISNYKLNQNLASSQFSLTPPEGSSIIDLR